MLRGNYTARIDAKGRLKPEYEEAIRIVADNNRALSFGHSTHPEIFALADVAGAYEKLEKGLIRGRAVIAGSIAETIRGARFPTQCFILFPWQNVPPRARIRKRKRLLWLR
jgi:hypothetical protein